MKTIEMEMLVTLEVPEFEHVQASTEDGELTLGIGKFTAGVDWRELKVGQRLLCLVEDRPLPRVLSAKFLSDPNAAGHPHQLGS